MCICPFHPTPGLPLLFQRFISICLNNRKSNLYGTLRILMCPRWNYVHPLKTNGISRFLESFHAQLTQIDEPFVSLTVAFFGGTSFLNETA